METKVESNDLNILKYEFERMARSRRVDYKLDYSIKLNMNGNVIVANSSISIQDAERSLYSTAISQLQTLRAGQQTDQQANMTASPMISPTNRSTVVQPADEAMIEDEPIENVINNEIKKVTKICLLNRNLN